jgi:hypothetical protein
MGSHNEQSDLEARARALLSSAKRPLSRDRIADLLRLSYADTSRLISDLRAAGVVEIVATRTGIRYRLTMSARNGGEP